MTPASTIVIGFDSADFDLIRGWAEDGALPNFRRLFETTHWGRVINPFGLEAGSVWPTFATGVMPDYHGQYEGWTKFDTDTYKRRQLRPDEVPVEPFWRTLSRNGKRVTIIDFPYAFLETDLNGIQVADWLYHVKTLDNGLSTIPPELAEEIKSRFGSELFPSDSLCPANECDVSQAATVADFRDRLIKGIRWKTTFATELLRAQRDDLFLAVFTEAHDAGHKLWHVHDPTHELHNPQVAQQVGNPIKAVYIALDDALGKLLEAADPRAAVFIYCSHGIGPERTASNFLTDILEAVEAAYVGPPPEPALDRIRRMYRALVPKMLRDRIHTTTRAQRTIQAIEHSRITSRLFFELTPNHATGGVRFNVKGRERYGRISPSHELQELRERLIKDLRTITNADSGFPLIDTITVTDDVYTGPMRPSLPDLLLEWNKRGPIVRVHSPLFGTLVNPRGRPRTGDHVHKKGVFFAKGAGLANGMRAQEVRTVDFAPTFAALLNCDTRPYQGVPLKGITPARDEN